MEDTGLVVVVVVGHGKWRKDRQAVVYCSRLKGYISLTQMSGQIVIGVKDLKDEKPKKL